MAHGIPLAPRCCSQQEALVLCLATCLLPSTLLDPSQGTLSTWSPGVAPVSPHLFRDSLTISWGPAGEALASTYHNLISAPTPLCWLWPRPSVEPGHHGEAQPRSRRGLRAHCLPSPRGDLTTCCTLGTISGWSTHPGSSCPHQSWAGPFQVCPQAVQHEEASPRRPQVSQDLGKKFCARAQRQEGGKATQSRRGRRG